MKLLSIPKIEISTNSSMGPGRLRVTDSAAKSMASAIFQQLQDNGCAPRDIISVSTQLLDLVTQEIGKKSPQG